MDDLNLRIFDVNKLLNYINTNLRKDSESVVLGLEKLVDYTKQPLSSISKSYTAHEYVAPIIIKSDSSPSSNKVVGKIYLETGVLANRKFSSIFFENIEPHMDYTYYEHLIMQTHKSIQFNNGKLPPSTIILALPYSCSITDLCRVDKQKSLLRLINPYSESLLIDVLISSNMFEHNRDFSSILPTEKFISDTYLKKSPIKPNLTNIPTNWVEKIIPLGYLPKTR